jgi:hypothetical protein
LRPIVLKKSFLGDERDFLEPLMHFMRGDVRDHIVSGKSEHGPSYRRKELCSRRDVKKINFSGSFGGVRFSTFATQSAKSGRSVISPRVFSAQADINSEGDLPQGRRGRGRSGSVMLATLPGRRPRWSGRSSRSRIARTRSRHTPFSPSKDSDGNVNPAISLRPNQNGLQRKRRPQTEIPARFCAQTRIRG